MNSNNFAQFQLKNSLHSLTFSVYIKDKKGKYLDVNEEFAHATGINSTDAVLHCTDYDFTWQKQARVMQENDNIIISCNEPKLFYEYANCVYGKNRVYESYKMPFRGIGGKIIGVLGISTVKEEGFIPKRIFKNKAFISPRQKDCLYFLVMGMTFKQIAAELNISPKTVEHYIEAVKIKLNCVTRHELVKQTIELRLLDILF